MCQRMPVHAEIEQDFRETDLLVPNRDVLTEHAYLVAREVRPLAIGGHFPTGAASVLRIATLIEDAATGEDVLPFVIDHGDGTGSFGYAANRWTLDFYEWAVTDRIPEQQMHRIVGMLLGYSPVAISRYEDSGCGRRFAQVA